MRPNTRTCFLESPTNPTLDVMDISAIAEIAHAHGLPLIVDAVYGYQARNVEAQAGQPGSLLNWTRRILAVRATSTAFGRTRASSSP